MKQSEITTIRNTINNRISEIVDSTIPAAKTTVDANAEITKALVHGKPLKMRSPAEIRKRALDLIASERYSSSRHLGFTDIYESTAEVKATLALADATNRKRDKLALALAGVRERVIADCKLGRFDAEQGAALDTFEAKAAEVVDTHTVDAPRR